MPWKLILLDFITLSRPNYWKIVATFLIHNNAGFWFIILNHITLKKHILQVLEYYKRTVDILNYKTYI